MVQRSRHLLGEDQGRQQGAFAFTATAVAGGRAEGTDEGGASEPPAQVKGLGGSAGYKDAWRRGETPPCVSYPLSNCKSPLKEDGGDAFLIPLFFFSPLATITGAARQAGFLL